MTKFVFGLLFIFATMFAVLGCQTAEKEEQKADLHLQIGISYYNSGNYPLALNEMLKARDLDPRNTKILNNLGLAYYMRGKADLAVKTLRDCLDIDSKDTDARNNLVRVLIEKKDYPAAQKEMNLVFSDLTYGGLDRAYLNQGFLYFNQNKFVPAEQAFAKSIDVQKDNCVSRNYYARSIFEQSDYARSTTAFDKAIAFCQKVLVDEPHYFSALAYFRAGDKDRAKTRFQELIRIYPNGKYIEKSRQMLELLGKAN